MPLSRIVAALVIVIGCFVLPSKPTARAEEGFVPLFNGRDLSGWQRVNTDERTWSVKDGMLICTGKPIGELRTTKMYQNFILEVEWRHMVPRGNAGIFVWADDITAKGQPFHRGIEVQVLENAYGNTRGHTTHGDIFPIHGAKMTPINGRGGSRAFPTESRSNPSPEWNHYRIEAIDGEISLAVNGKVVTRGKDCEPRKGYLCIESEGGVVHYRNMNIKELPDSPIDAAMVAKKDRGYRCLYTGIDLTGWKSNGNWRPSDWRLKYDGAEKSDAFLETEERFGHFGFVADVRLNKDSGVPVLVLGDGPLRVKIDRGNEAWAQVLGKPGQWNRIEGEVRRDSMSLRVNGKLVADTVPLEGDRSATPFRIEPAGPVEFANLYVRSLE